MTWHPLGSISITREWQTLGTLAAGDPLFRITQQWVGEWPGTGHLQLSFLYDGAGRYGYRKVASDKHHPTIILCPVPEQLQAAGLTARQMAVRLSLYARLYSNSDWVISVDQWVQPSNAIS